MENIATQLSSVTSLVNISPKVMVFSYAIFAVGIMGLFFWKARQALTSVLSLVVVIGLFIAPFITTSLIKNQTTIGSQASAAIRILSLSAVNNDDNSITLNFVLSEPADAYVNFTDNETAKEEPILAEYGLEKRKRHIIVIRLKPNQTGKGIIMINGEPMLWRDKPLILP